MRLVVILLIIGFPTLIIFSWIYDVTPEGVVKTEPKTSSFKSNYSILILILVIGGGLLFYFQDRLFKSAVNPKSVAVLPFDNYSPNPEDKYLSAGFTEVIIANLAKVQDLMVISRTSVMRYEDTKMRLRDIAEELNVANILEGSIQRTGNKIRVVGQLIEAKSDKHLWAETYDSDFNNIFTIQTSIAKEIAASLKSRITESEKSGIEEIWTENIEAYELFLKVKELRQITNYYDNSELRINLLDKAIDLDSEFAEAYAQLSIEHSENVHFGMDQSQSRKDLARINIERAFQLKPENPFIRFAFGYYYYGCFKNYQKALEHYQYSLSKEPGNRDFNEYIGYVHRRLGNWNETVVYLEKAAELDPNHLGTLDNLIGTYYFLKDYKKINLIEIDKKYYRLVPNDGNLYSFRAKFTFWMDGHTENARKIIENSTKLTPDFDYYQSVLWELDIFDGHYEKYLEYTLSQEDSVSFSQSWIWPKSGHVGFAYWLMDDEENQINESKKALEFMLNHPEYQGDPRYHASLGLINAMLGRKEDALREAKLAIALSPPSKDVYLAGNFEGNLAQIYTIIGEHELALDMIEKFLSGPSNYDWTDIKYYDTYHKVFKNNPRFIKMVKQDEDRFRKEVTYDLSIYLP